MGRTVERGAWGLLSFMDRPLLDQRTTIRIVLRMDITEIIGCRPCFHVVKNKL